MRLHLCLYVLLAWVSLGHSAASSAETTVTNDVDIQNLGQEPVVTHRIIPNKTNSHALKQKVAPKDLPIEPVCFKTGQRSQQFYADGALHSPHITPMEYLISKHRLSKKKGNVFNAKEQKCLTTAIYHEARGETLKGQIAVAQVIINRMLNDDFPNTVCGVVYQRNKVCQFSFACQKNNQKPLHQDSWDQAQMIVSNFIRGNIWLNDIANATYFHTISVRPSWRTSFCRLRQVGSHIFYKTPDAFKVRYSLDKSTQKADTNTEEF